MNNTTHLNLIAAISLCTTVIPNIASAVAVSGQGTWETTLQARDLDGNLTTAEAYYDTAQNITWLADANYGYGSNYDNADGNTDGEMTWENANAWAANLNPYDSGITGWRLPITVDVGNDGTTYPNYYQGVDAGYNITTHSEMSHMFYVTLGDLAFTTIYGDYAQPGWGLTNTGPFLNMQPYTYWSSTDYVLDTNFAWYFSYYEGFQSYADKSGALSAWAVHAGDIGVAIPSSVPIPAAAWLFGSGLLGLLSVFKRKSA